MVERNTFRLWTMRATFLALGLATIFIYLLPLQTGPARWPTPDILLALCLAWSKLATRDETRFIPYLNFSGEPKDVDPRAILFRIESLRKEEYPFCIDCRLCFKKEK